jgi:cytidine deaminase
MSEFEEDATLKICLWVSLFCTERAAVAAKIAAGDNDFIAIVIVADSNQPAMPCGASRKVLAEFNARSKSLRPQSDSRGRSLALSDLLPLPKPGIV